MASDNIHKFLVGTLDVGNVTRSPTPAIQGLVLIDLNDFTSSPSVSINPTGNSAIMALCPLNVFVFLEHNPALDPAQIIPRAGVSLKFDFNFVKAPGEDDEFGAFLLDKSGVPIGLRFEFFVEDSSNGTVSFDLSSLSSDPVGLVFILTSLNSIGDLHDSSVEISNVRLSTDGDPTTDSPRPTSSSITLTH